MPIEHQNLPLRAWITPKRLSCFALNDKKKQDFLSRGIALGVQKRLDSRVRGNDGLAADLIISGWLVKI
jgi:hypothetical protein